MVANDPVSYGLAQDPRPRLRRSAPADQRMTLLAHAETSSPAVTEIRAADAGMDGEDGLVVEPYAAPLDQPAALAFGTRHAESDGDVDDEYRLVAGQSKGGQSFRRSSRKRERRGGGCLSGGFIAMTEPRGLGGKQLFGCIDVGMLELLEPGYFGNRQIGEHAQEPSDVAVLGIAPKLPVVIRREALGAQTDGAADTLAPLWPRRGFDVRL